MLPNTFEIVILIFVLKMYFLKKKKMQLAIN